jgi:hypothetical protein
MGRQTPKSPKGARDKLKMGVTMDLGKPVSAGETGVRETGVRETGVRDLKSRFSRI